MLTGYNTDFKFQGKVYHIQTEDGGISSPYITSLLYFGGAIIASRKTTYADIIKADCLDEVVRELMMEQHKQMIRDLMHGKLEFQQAGTRQAPKAAPAQPSPRPVPAREEPPSVQIVKPARSVEASEEKSLDDVILEFLAQEEKAKGLKK